jgi:hypothetical protein
MRRLIAASALLLLAACSTPAPVVRTVYLLPDVPPSFLTCSDAPPVPTSTLQSAAVDYMIEQRAAWLDCSDHLAAVGQALAAAPAAH